MGRIGLSPYRVKTSARAAALAAHPAPRRLFRYPHACARTTGTAGARSPSAAPGTARTRLNREALIAATEPPQGAQAILRALSVLQAFSADRAWMSATEVAEVTGLSAATTHRILKTLQSQSYLEQDSHTRAYSLGIGILKLASLIADRHDEVALLSGALTRIRELTGETVSLHRRVGDRRIRIAEEVSRQPVEVSAGIGNSYRLNGGAASKAIMSALPDEEVERIQPAARGPGPEATSAGGVPARGRQDSRARLRHEPGRDGAGRHRHRGRDPPG